MSGQIDLPSAEVHAWFATLEFTDPLLAEARATLSAEENKRADRFVQDMHRNRYLLCHLKVRQILSAYFGVAPGNLTFQANEFGKPIIPEEHNPNGIYFNLSHSEDKMLLGIVRQANLGVDLEEIRPESATLEVADRFFTERENQELRTLSGPAQVEAFFRCWTRKEAYLKAIGCGLSIDPKHCEVSILPGEPPVLRKTAPPQNNNPWTLFSLAFGNCIGAIALDQPRVLKQKSG